MNPRTFFEDYVTPAIADWQHEGSVRRATIDLAEHTIIYSMPGLNRNGIRKERDRRATLVPALGVARDLHDTHKHGPLSRKSACITKDQTPQRIHHGGISSGPISAAPICGSVVELWIVTDDGNRHSLATVIQECTNYWRTEFAKHGI
jgi:hypothetical protein